MCCESVSSDANDRLATSSGSTRRVNGIPAIQVRGKNVPVSRRGHGTAGNSSAGAEARRAAGIDINERCREFGMVLRAELEGFIGVLLSLGLPGRAQRCGSVSSTPSSCQCVA